MTSKPTQASNTVLIGLDDTDNADSRGTGFRARQLGLAADAAGLGQLVGVTRHQLFFDPRIPYTSHNSSACLQFAAVGDREALWHFCWQFMLAAAEDGSDIGLCLADLAQAAGLREHGRAAKHRVLPISSGPVAAGHCGARVAGLTGNRQGMIGATAACGLFADGDDGRYIWAPGVRDLVNRRIRVEEFLAVTGIDDIRDREGTSHRQGGDRELLIGDWPRPVRIRGDAVLLVEPSAAEPGLLAVLPKAEIKAFRP